MRLGIWSNKIQLRVRPVRRLLAGAVAILLAGFGIATMEATAASAAFLYCNNESSLWDECVYHYTNSSGQNIIQAQSHDSGVGPIYGHTEIRGTQGCSGTVYKNSSNYELDSGHTQSASLNFGARDSCHTRWCAFFWQSNNNGGWIEFSGECKTFDG
jgi:hypothetical protein